MRVVCGCAGHSVATLINPNQLTRRRMATFASCYMFRNFVKPSLDCWWWWRRVILRHLNEAMTNARYAGMAAVPKLYIKPMFCSFLHLFRIAKHQVSVGYLSWTPKYKNLSVFAAEMCFWDNYFAYWCTQNYNFNLVKSGTANCKKIYIYLDQLQDKIHMEHSKINL